MTEKTGHTPAEQTQDEKPAVQIERPTLAGGFPGNIPGNDSPLFRESVFGVDESTFRSSLPKVTHWSIAWSDLMMTMFILFLSMFVYQAAHKEFLVSDEIEVIGGDTAEALEVGSLGEAVFPFVPIMPAPPLMTSGTVKKVETIRLQDIDVDATFFNESKTGGLARIEENLAQSKEQKTEQTRPAAKDEEETAADIEDSADTGVSKVFTMEKEALSKLDLKDFATIDLVPDKTMRIILAGDLLFNTGEAELSRTPKTALRKIAAVIKNTPYMINIVGHTDNIPMNSERFATNWELSVARASTVARFLIEEMDMNPNQFVVSGYSSYRPIKPNTNTRNRAVNRRVEIIISKRRPIPVAASAENIN